jgi:hypothetical protein
MPNKEQAFDDLFKRFQSKLKSPLTPDGAREFIEIYEDTVGYYLDCKKVEKDRDYWDVEKFRDWAFDSVDKFATQVDKESGEKPAKPHHVRTGANKAFDEIKADPDEYCNKGNIPHCSFGLPAEIFGPVCTLYYQKRAAREGKETTRAS